MKATTIQAIHWRVGGAYRFIRRHVIYLDEHNPDHGTLKDGRRVQKDSKGVWILDILGGGAEDGTQN